MLRDIFSNPQISYQVACSLFLNFSLLSWELLIIPSAFLSLPTFIFQLPICFYSVKFWVPQLFVIRIFLCMIEAPWYFLALASRWKCWAAFKLFFSILLFALIIFLFFSFIFIIVCYKPHIVIVFWTTPGCFTGTFV